MQVDFVKVTITIMNTELLGGVVAECIACSECEYQLDYFGDVGASDYCPNCGAKMEEIK